MNDNFAEIKSDNINDNIKHLIASRTPLSRQARKIYETIFGAGGFLKTHTITFSRAIGISSTGQNEFLALLDECIEKDYVRTIIKDGMKDKNGYFTFEYFYREVVPRLELQNPQAYQFHIEYISDKIQEVQSGKEPR